MPQDNRYRDLCVTGANLSQSNFDPNTGMLVGDYGDEEDYSPESPVHNNSADSPPSIFDTKYTGNVNGAKPPLGQCMPMKDTPLISLDYAGTDRNALAFAYYINMNDEKFIAGANKPDIYERSNFYKDETFFIGGSTGCPEIIDFADSPPMLPETLLARTDMRRMQADLCYNFYILNHSVSPEYTMERPAGQTNDPLSKDNPLQSIVNNCQPLINGNDATLIQLMQNPRGHNGKPSLLAKDVGYSTVWVYPYRADMDEADYPLGYYLDSSWHDLYEPPEAIESGYQYQIKLANSSPNFFNVGLPCLQAAPTDTSITTSAAAATTAAAMPPASYRAFPNPPPLVPAAAAAPARKCQPDSPASQPESPTQQSSGDSPCPNNSYAPIIPDLPYTTFGDMTNATVQYCPNVEKITEPSHPFSPRDDVPVITRNSAPIAQDRDYDAFTSMKLYNPTKPACMTESSPNQWGYTDFNQTPDVRDPNYDKIMNPVVQCAIVPVDILHWRADSFDDCIMERINYNVDAYLNLWVAWDKANKAAKAANKPLPYKVDSNGYTLAPPPERTDHGGIDPHDRTPGVDQTGFNPPCKTRFWETDTSDVATGCPVSMSIQQCCHIIVKDVVPANFLKMRSCEGLKDIRSHDTQLQRDLGGDADSPVLYVYSGGNDAWGTDNNQNGLNYQQALQLTRELNQDVCINTEPPEYHFNYWFEAFDEPSGGPSKTPPGLIGYHMPYMRWWDTGVAAGNPIHGGDFVNTLGGFDTLIGVGREARTAIEGKQAVSEYWQLKSSRSTTTTVAQLVGLNGLEVPGGTPSSMSPPPPTPSPFDMLKTSQLSQMGRVGGWDELKAHEMWTIRNNNLFCLGRYETLFKPGDADNLVLAKAGAGYTTPNGVQEPWALGWRGYASDSHAYKNFPWLFNTGTSAVEQGLDNVQDGDIIVYDINGMSIPAYVVSIGFPIQGVTYNASSDDWLNPDGSIATPDRVVVVTWDQGQFPTSTGNNIMWGMGPSRTIWKKAIPPNNAIGSTYVCSQTLRAMTYYIDPQNPNPDAAQCQTNPGLDSGTCATLQCQPSCTDPSYPDCILPVVNGQNQWDQVQVYHPKQDVRQCTATITDNPNFSMPATYAWRSQGPLTPLPDDVIAQYNSSSFHAGLWESCINGGYDPPPDWDRDYSGPMTGAITSATSCGPEWHTKPDDQHPLCWNLGVQAPDGSSNVYEFCHYSSGYWWPFPPSFAGYDMTVFDTMIAAGIDQMNGCNATGDLFEFFPKGQ